MKRNSLAFRLFATSLAWMLAVLPVVGYLIYSTHRENVQTKFDSDLQQLLTAIAFDSMNTSGDEPITPKNLYEPLFEETHSGWYWQIRPIDGAPGRRLVSPSLASEVLPSPYDRKFPTDPATAIRWMNVPGPLDQTIRILEIIKSPGYDAGKTQYSVIVAGPMDWMEADNKRFLNWLSVVLALAGLALLASTLFQVRFGLAPLRRIERGLANIRSGTASKLAGRLPAEIEPMQAELNALIQSNQDIIDRARTQVGNLAHALKTPLAVITNEARETKGPFAGKVAEQAGIMREQVTHYLDRARMAANAGLGRVTDVEAAVEPLVRALERINREKGVSIEMQIAPGAKFSGEKHDLEEMLGNLLDNACKWAKKRVFLNVEIEAGEAGGGPKRLLVCVEDDGPGLTAEQRAKIGKRGVRLDEAKPGTGLGLSIVSDLAVSYRGAMKLDASGHGGLKAMLELPGV